ncbi:MAG: adenylate/guanylate cyclase domain-containing protein [Cyanobacteriota bacterium]|nr:adenylate/guanylate cyclase domain-containing protein [Cyanobacteriota bacterium]
MLPSKILPWLRLFQARLSQRLVFWIFASIVFIEIVILIPSYWAEEQRQLQSLEDISKATLSSVQALSQTEGFDSEECEREIQNIVSSSEAITGIAIYMADGTRKKLVGEAPQLSFADVKNPREMIKHKRFGARYDIALKFWSANGNWLLIVRQDASQVRIKLIEFIIRIAILILIISTFVTVVMTLVLGITVIDPILRLRDDLKTAGEALSRDKTNVEFYSLSVQRQDELGEVMLAFKEMFERVSWEIEKRKRTEDNLRVEQAKSEKLLLNILPPSIAQQLKEKQSTIAQRFSEVTILFADIVNFTPLSSSIPPEKLVELLNQIFSGFDRLTEKYGLEKIKTIGDSYMVAAGLPIPKSDSAEAIAKMAIDMRSEIAQFFNPHGVQLQIRIGINTGPVVAGVIGTKKFIYDLWGDAVNIASRMESQGIPGQIQVSESTYQLLQDKYKFEERGGLNIKGRGMMTTYLLIDAIAEEQAIPDPVI